MTDLVERFMGLLSAAMADGRAHVALRNGRGPHPDAETYFAVVQGLASECGETVPVGQKTLHKQLRERGLLRSIDAKRGRLTVRRTLEGRRRQVLQLCKAFLPASESSHSARAGNAVQSGAAAR